VADLEHALQLGEELLLVVVRGVLQSIGWRVGASRLPSRVVVPPWRTSAVIMKR